MDLPAIGHNVTAVRSRLPESTRLIAVVKANGYGHGAPQAAATALAAGAWGLAVSTLEEARQLSGLQLGPRLLLIGGLAPQEAAEAARTGCAVTCSSPELARALEAGAVSDRPVPVHLKIDTGMGRLGVQPAEAAALARQIEASPRLVLAGTMTHYASSESDRAFTENQHRLFVEVLTGLGVDPGLRHASNSAAALRYPQLALDAVRVGIALYGCEDSGLGLRPALALRALVTHVKRVPRGATVGYGSSWRAERESEVATVAIGYADGVHRARSGRGQVLVAGGRAPLIGRVSMDAITLDVTGLGQVRPGDTATLIGADDGERITAEEVGEWSGTISYEVLTAIGNRVERTYPGSGEGAKAGAPT